MSGSFEGFAHDSQCIVWVGDIMTPATLVVILPLVVGIFILQKSRLQWWRYLKRFPRKKLSKIFDASNGVTEPYQVQMECGHTYKWPFSWVTWVISPLSVEWWAPILITGDFGPVNHHSDGKKPGEILFWGSSGSTVKNMSHPLASQNQKYLHMFLFQKN